MSEKTKQIRLFPITIKCRYRDYSWDVAEDSTVLQLREELSREYDFPMERQNLIHRGNRLDDNLTMRDAAVVRNSVIYVKIDPKEHGADPDAKSGDEESDESGPYPVRIKFLYKEEVVPVHPYTTVKVLKNYMSQHFDDMAAEDQHVSFRGRELDDELTMYNAFVQANNTLYIKMIRAPRDSTPSVKSFVGDAARGPKTPAPGVCGSFSKDERVGVVFGRKLIEGRVRFFEKKRGKNKYFIRFSEGRSDWVSANRVVGLAQEVAEPSPKKSRKKRLRKPAVVNVPATLERSVISLATVMAEEAKLSDERKSEKIDTPVQKTWRPREPRVTLRVTNLPSWYEVSDLAELFSGYRMQWPRVYKPRNERRDDDDTCTAVVTLPSKKVATEAIRHLNRTRLGGLVITVQISHQNSVISGGKTRGWKK